MRSIPLYSLYLKQRRGVCTLIIMFKKFSQKYNRIKDNKGGIFSLIGVSLIILALTAAVYVVGDYFTSYYRGEKTIAMWSYNYTENAGAVPDRELRILNSQNPIVTDAGVRKNALYLTKPFEPVKKSKTLVILTDHSPVMIKINGKEVYNNQFESADFVGNCYNAVKLDASARDQEVEVFLKLPFSVRFDASFSDSENAAFILTLGLITSGVLITLGFCLLVFFAVLSLRKHRFFHSVITAFLITYTGVALTIINLSEVTYIFNAPFWLGVKTVAAHLTLLLGAACISTRLLNRRKFVSVGVSAAGIILLAGAASVVPFLFVFAEAVISVVTLAYIVFIAYNIIQFVTERTLYAVPLFVISSYYATASFLSGLFLLLRAHSMYNYAISVPTLVVIGVLEYINIADYRYNQKNSDFQEQTLRYGESVENISTFIRNMLMCGDKNVFFDTAVRETITLIKKYNIENSALHCSVGVKAENGFVEIINDGISDCNYDIIEKNSLMNNKECIFSETYFDFVLKKESEVSAVIHFENVINGLDVFFINIIETAYCGLDTAYQKLYNGQQDQLDVIFTELAENTEVDNGYSPEHLVHIAEYVFVLCRKLGMSEEESKRVSLASKLHDIGKIAIPKGIINKEGRLTKEEQIVVSCHTKFGYILLSAYSDDPFLSDAAVIARYHHERYDGTGTNGLKGEDIPLIARISTVCDVYDALVSERSYKRAWSREKAQNYLKEYAGTIFDPKLVEVFLAYLSENEPTKQEAE